MRAPFVPFWDIAALGYVPLWGVPLWDGTRHTTDGLTRLFGAEKYIDLFSLFISNLDIKIWLNVKFLFVIDFYSSPFSRTISRDFLGILGLMVEVRYFWLPVLFNGVLHFSPINSSPRRSHFTNNVLLWLRVRLKKEFYFSTKNIIFVFSPFYKGRVKLT